MKNKEYNNWNDYEESFDDTDDNENSLTSSEKDPDYDTNTAIEIVRRLKHYCGNYGLPLCEFLTINSMREYVENST